MVPGQCFDTLRCIWKISFRFWSGKRRHSLDEMNYRECIFLLLHMVWTTFDRLHCKDCCQAKSLSRWNTVSTLLHSLNTSRHHISHRKAFWSRFICHCIKTFLLGFVKHQIEEHIDRHKASSRRSIYEGKASTMVDKVIHTAKFCSQPCSNPCYYWVYHNIVHRFRIDLVQIEEMCFSDFQKVQDWSESKIWLIWSFLVVVIFNL